MSDLEDDVLLAYLKAQKELNTRRERDPLVNDVWKSLDRLVRAILRHPEIGKTLKPELDVVQKTVVAVLTFDEEHMEGPDAKPPLASG